MRRTLAFVPAALIVVLLAVVVVVAPLTCSDRAVDACDCTFWRTPADMIPYAEAIVVVRPVEKHRVELTFPGDTFGTYGGKRDVWLVEVVDAIRGDVSGRVAVHDVVGSVKKDTLYVLALGRGSLEAKEFPDLWTVVSEPGNARIEDNGDLTFATTGGYRKLLKQELGIEGGRSGAGPAFDITLDQFRALVATTPRLAP